MRSNHETNQEGVTFASKAKKTQCGSSAFNGKDVPCRHLMQRTRMVAREKYGEILDADLHHVQHDGIDDIGNVIKIFSRQWMEVLEMSERGEGGQRWRHIAAAARPRDRSSLGNDAQEAPRLQL